MAILFSSACDGGGGVAIIDSAGGEVSGSGASVTIPAGALGSETMVEIGVAPASLSAMPAGMQLAGNAIAFTPHGTQFASPVRLTLPHDGSATGAMRLDDEFDTTWEPVTTTLITAGEVLLDVNQFSIYAAVRTGSVGDVDAGTSIPLGDSGPPVGDVDAGGTEVVDGGGTPPNLDGGGTGTGDADAGGTVDSCAAIEPGAPNGTASLVGASFDAADVIAVVNHRTGVGTEFGAFDFMSTLTLRFTSYPDACGLENAARGVRGADNFTLRFLEYSNTAQPGLPATGTHTWVGTDPVIDTPHFSGGGQGGTYHDVEAGTCSASGRFLSPTVTPSGSVTLTNVTSSLLEGTFTYTNNEDTTYSGSFSAPICGSTTGPTNGEYCCR